MKMFLLASASVALISTNIGAQDSFPEIKFHGLVDVRAVRGSDQLSWFDNGLSKVRYGANSDGARSFLDFAEASLIAEAQFSWSLSAMAHIKFDPEQRNAVDIVEAFLRYEPVSTSAWRIKAKAGMFFPPISLEHRDIAWTSPYSLTPSAINSWVGEELKATGLELTLEHRSADHTLSLTGSAFMLNDPAGTILAWRGWALHDVKSTVFGRFALPDINSLSSVFRKQSPWIEPHLELDDRVSYYVKGKWDMHDIGSLSVFYYDNRADPLAFDNGQYGWETDFINVGTTLFLPADIELLAQYMYGNTKMGPKFSDYHVVDVNFSSYYILLSKMIGEQRLSMRYDNFKTDDLFWIDLDNNNENGHAWMASLSRIFDNGHRLMLEAQIVDSDRANRADLAIPTRAKENQLQLSFRFAF